MNSTNMSPTANMSATAIRFVRKSTFRFPAGDHVSDVHLASHHLPCMDGGSGRNCHWGEPQPTGAIDIDSTVFKVSMG